MKAKAAPPSCVGARRKRGRWWWLKQALTLAFDEGAVHVNRKWKGSRRRGGNLHPSRLALKG